MPPGQLRHPSEDDFQKGRPRAGSNDTQQTYGTYDQDDRDSVVTQQEPLLPASHPRKWPKRKKALVLLVVSGCSFIVALSQAIYLPSIAIIQESFQTTRQLVLYSLTLPLVVLGIMNNFVGPISEHYGRRYLHLFGMIVFTLASVGCALAPNIEVFIAVRVIQALGSSAPSIVGAGTVSDMYEIHERGKALGFFLLGALIGPVLGPATGGALADLLYWQDLFWIITGLAGFFTILSILVMRETLVKEEHSHCTMPWEPFKYLGYTRVSLIIMMLTVTFAGFFCLNINFALVLSKSYNLDSAIVGVCYLPFGLGLLVGSVIGGRSSDRIRQKGGTPEHRLIPTLVFLPLNGICIIMQGWGFQYKFDLSIIIIMSFFFGITFVVTRPGSNTYMIEKLKDITGKDASSSITGLTYAIMLPVSAIVAQSSIRGVLKLEEGYFLTIIGGAVIACTIPIAFFVFRDIRRHKVQTHKENGIN